MKTPARRAAAGAVALTGALAGAVALAGAAQASQAYGGAPVYALTDTGHGNAVVAYDAGLNRLGSYPTGGLGGALTGSVVDHLASQGALALDRAHGLLYAVNAGSDTLAVFALHGDRLSRVQVIATGGAFPVSVTAHGNQVYVLNARDGGSIQGYLRVGGRLVKVGAWHQSLGLPVTTGAQEFTHTPGQVAFTPDGTKLVVTTKAAANSIMVFGVDTLGGPSAHPAITTVAGAVPFAVDFDSAGRVVVAEAGVNALATFTVDRGGALTAVGQSPTGQAATCWIAGAHGVFYGSNAGSGSVSGFRDARGSLQALGNTPTAAGSVDAATSGDGRRLYVRGGSAGVLVGFRINRDGSLTPTGTVTVPDSAGAEGLAAS